MTEASPGHQQPTGKPKEPAGWIVVGSLELDGEVWAMLYSVLHDLKLLLLYYRSYGDTAEGSGKRKKGHKQ